MTRVLTACIFCGAAGGHRRDCPVDPTPAREAGKAAVQFTGGKHADEIAALVPTAQQLALRAQQMGITTSDLRAAANIPPGKGRELSWLTCVMRAAGLVATDRMRPAAQISTHGRAVRVYVHPQFAGRS